MVTLRCTKKLLKKLGGTENTPESSTAATITTATTALGDWYATLIVARPKHLLLCVSEHSRLAVVFPAAPLTTLTPRFQKAVRELLQALNMPEAAVAREAQEMETVVVGPTQSRSVLGTMNEYVKMIHYKEYDAADEAGSASPLQMSVSLSRIIWSPLGYRYPDEVTRELLESGLQQSGLQQSGLLESGLLESNRNPDGTGNERAV